MPQPEHWRNGLVTVPKRQDLIPLIDIVNYLTDLSMIGEPWYGSPLFAADGQHGVPRSGVRVQRGGDGSAGGRRRICTRGRSSSSSTAPSARRSRTGNTRKSSSRARCPERRFTDGESLKVPLTRSRFEATTGPYPTNMRRNITQGVPGLGIWYRPAAPSRTRTLGTRRTSACSRWFGAAAKASSRRRRTSPTLRRELGMPSLFPNAIQTRCQLVSVQLHDGQRLRPRRR